MKAYLVATKGSGRLLAIATDLLAGFNLGENPIRWRQDASPP
jgi:hypothetical protein